MMSRSERVMAALEHKQSDQFPAFLLGADFEFYNQFISKVGFTHEEMKQYVKDGILFSPPVNHAVAVKLGFDVDWFTLISSQYYDAEQKIAMDVFGSTQKFEVKANGIPHLWYAGPGLNSEEKIKKWWDMGFPKPYSTSQMRIAMGQQRTLFKKYDEFMMFIGLPGPFENLSMPIGLGLMAKLCRKNQDMIWEILNRNFEVQGRALERLVRFKPPVVMCGDDYGFSEGLQMNAEYWRQFIKPILKQYVDIVHNGGSKFILHSCGRIGEIFPDFVELGIDGVESLQPNLVDLPYLKQKFGDKIAFLGTIDDSDLLVNATPAQVRLNVTDMIHKLGTNGGYIPGPTNFILNTKVENVQAMIDAIHSFRSK